MQEVSSCFEGLLEVLKVHFLFIIFNVTAHDSLVRVCVLVESHSVLMFFNISRIICHMTFTAQVTGSEICMWN